MVPDRSDRVQLADVTLGALLDALADRLAARVAALFARADLRGLAFARLDVETLRNMLESAGDAPALAKARQLAARIAEQLAEAAR